MQYILYFSLCIKVDDPKGIAIVDRHEEKSVFGHGVLHEWHGQVNLVKRGDALGH